ncbi:MAG: GNAT family N-acetyltransferase [Dehalococcoidia bacterium]|nr:GNAT family N-acetyltransferase [Dehalococcoidia bacterium]
MPEPRLRIRPATPEDASTVVGFVRGLAEFEREPASSVRLTEADLLRDGFGEHPRFEVLIAEVDGAPAGFALFFPNYSTWEGRAGLYIEDLFVDERARGTGAGRALVVEVARLAVKRGFARVDLSVLDWNPAREFYDRLGFRHQSEWLAYRLDGDPLLALAAGSEEAPSEG